MFIWKCCDNFRFVYSDMYMVIRAGIEDARKLADLAIQMWTDHDPKDLEEEFRKLAINDEAACFIKYL